jgi:hypothetical protein
VTIEGVVMKCFELKAGGVVVVVVVGAVETGLHGLEVDLGSAKIDPAEGPAERVEAFAVSYMFG